ncbi:DNA-directed RNA polymerase V subunit 1 isoform X2 [Lycium ferocissimum]|uniref:DNA-directed RNA polymerase V subunit 1 isoform X2 n=1 Tax=Lycium ferocissimum TaxID=112874 RepID=UPI002814A82A|nr:DNA-directed RNA polymerase V subunit 1 isoform X2 [Lycium ferocissimum]
MEESPSSKVPDGIVSRIKFGLATPQEICKSSISDCPITHPSLLLNPFLGLPLEAGRCESCGTAEPGKCEGHFGYIELPIPIYHPDHVSELKKMLSLLCLKCLKMKNRKVKHAGVLERMLSSCCEDVSQISIFEGKTSDGASYLELKVPKNAAKLPEWNFLEKYGYRYGDGYSRPLLPSEVLTILRRIREDTRKKLSAKGYFPQDGYILQYLPVPPNCLSVPDISDGNNIMSSDHSITMLRKVLRQIDIIKSSRSGTPNFEAHEVEANDLQAAVVQYLQFRGTGKASRDVDKRFGIKKEAVGTTTKAWLEKMKTLFIRKGSGFSSRSVITGDSYKGVGEIGLPCEIAQKITFEERVSQHNMSYLQKLVDEKLCLTYKDGSSTYSLREGSKGHTFLRPGQIVHRRIMDGDIVFINRPPTTHKHSLQALSVYVHDDHTVKINPLMCGPLSADFDGDCIHLFYPQSLSAKAEVVELFSVGKQLLSSHTGNFNLQLATDSLLSLKLMFSTYFYHRAAAQQLAMFLQMGLPDPAVVDVRRSGTIWTALQILGTALPDGFDSCGETHTIGKSQFLGIEYNRDLISSIINDVITSVYFMKGPNDVLKFFNSLQPLLMENLCSEGFSISLRDFYMSKAVRDGIQERIQCMSKLLHHLRASYNESVEVQLEHHLRNEKLPVMDFVLKSSGMGVLIDSKSESALNKVVQQIGFLGLQISDRGKFYSKTLVNDMARLFQRKYPSVATNPSEEFGLVRSCLFYGLDPYQEMTHSISSREVIVRSSRGLTEPGTLFKNLMAILRDVVICYDGTVRNVSSNSIIQFEYGASNGSNFPSEFCAGDPVGVLAATAMSNPAYKAVLDSSPSSNSSWEMMKEILLCGVSFKNDVSDRRVILYLNDCGCRRGYCKEKAAYIVKNHLSKVCLKDAADEFLIEYGGQQAGYENSETGTGLIGHIRLNQGQLENLGIGVLEVLERCQVNISSFQRRKKIGNLFKRIVLSVSEFCSFCHNSGSKCLDTPCLRFSWPDASDDHLERVSHILADMICPILLDTVIKGDPRVSSASIAWISPDTMSWIRSPSKSQRGELALDIVLEREAVKQRGDAWRILMDSCLPVIHLIDTTRSIPYAIKQVQELIGISCAFEQAVKRLSTSVTMVTKGVLKDHLVLLANSMTCAGNLVGFNAGGIKALSRSLNVQIPFTEATLFTPRKCFERAAEKCHVDSLTSIVASCSWGKHVAVGTGSRFEVLLNTKNVEWNIPDARDVYSFLHLVRSSSSQEVEGTSCLGAEVDELEEDEDMGLYLSPDRDSGADMPTFEDRAEFDDTENLDEGKLTGSAWEKASSEKSGGCWDMAGKSQNGAEKGVNQSDSWSSWGKKVDEAVSDPQQSGNGEQLESWSAWGEKAKEADSNPQQSGVGEQSAWGKKSDRDGGSSWGQKVDKDGGSWGKKVETENTPQLSGKEDSGSWSSWKKPVDKDGGSSWGQQVEKDGGSWGKKVETENTPQLSGKEVSGSWSSRAKPVEKEGGSSWGQKVEKDGGSWGKKFENENTPQLSGKEDSGSWSSRAKPVEKDGVSSWGQKVEKDGGSWGKKFENENTPRLSGKEDSGSWSSRAKPVEKDGGSSWGQKVEKDGGSWGKRFENENTRQRAGKEEQSGSRSSWAKQVEKDGGSSWGQKVDKDGGSWGKKVETENIPQLSGKEDSGSWSSWTKPVDKDGGSSWGQQVDKNGGSWDKKVETENIPQVSGKEDSGSWSSWAKLVEKDGESSLGKKVDEPENNPNQSGNGEQSGSWSSWGKKVEKDGSWDGPKQSNSESSWGKATKGGGLGSATAQGNDWSSSISGDGQLNKSTRDDSTNIGGWNSSTVGGWNSQKVGVEESDKQPQWGQRRRNPRGDFKENSRGWGSTSGGDWKNNRPARSADDFNRGGNFTATRQRMDIFTAEELEILSDVDPIMLKIRKIMHGTGYNDGDPLSADDQSYVIDSVLNYHPDKAVKMGAGLDYIMVSKHTDFQDTRCFYVVSTDGAKQDFSTRKCLENYIRSKYPDKAETFNGKYFKKPQPRIPKVASPSPSIPKVASPSPSVG